MGAHSATNSQDTLPKPPDLSPMDNSGSIVAAPHTVAEYQAKYERAKVRPEHLAELKSICGKIMINSPRYQEVQSATGVPWYVVGAIHERESSMRFDTYLQNGDPLFSKDGAPLKTVHVPKGIGPFSPQTWANAAIHAFGGEGAHKGVNWTLGYCLMWAENFNGLGMRHRGLPSGYIWSFTDQYVRAKYVADGVFSPTEVDKQAGVAAILKVLGI